MKVSEVVRTLNLKVFSGDKGLDNEVTGGYVCDLLSDVMGNSKEGQVWITLQTHKNVIAIASLRDLAAVILVNGCKPDDDLAIQSDEEGIPVLGTNETAFVIAGKLYALVN
ncbi:MAG TPA: DRTGG domain-containing protein [Bacteroidales bacterium]|nr:DRTGG domain-containing protein [Bacteroidales bacterium]